jgi:hypothetical protein
MRARSGDFNLRLIIRSSLGATYFPRSTNYHHSSFSHFIDGFRAPIGSGLLGLQGKMPRAFTNVSDEINRNVYSILLTRNKDNKLEIMPKQTKVITGKYIKKKNIILQVG